MRLVIASLLITVAMHTDAVAQTVNCQLFGEDYGYGLFGTCNVESAQDPPNATATSQRLRFWPQGEVNVIVTSHPSDGSPWRGYFFVGQGREWTDSFEMTKELGPSGERLVLRSMVGWVVVHKWQKTRPGAAVLEFRLNYPRATSDDVSLLSTALNQLSTAAAWDRNDDRDCTNDTQGRGSVFCVLQRATESQLGRYQHAQPALDLVRRVIVERWAARVNRGHAFTNFNNHPDTMLEDVRDVLQEALRRAMEERDGSK